MNKVGVGKGRKEGVVDMIRAGRGVRRLWLCEVGILSYAVRRSSALSSGR